MIEPKALRIIVLSVVVLAIAFGILSFLKIQYQFYIWEVFVDLKILSLLFIAIFFKRKSLFQFTLDNLHLKKWKVTTNVLWFFSPIFFYAVVVSSGMVFHHMHLESFDNAATLMLATLFDIPAIFVFSATTILIEEIFFRAMVFDSLRMRKSFWISVVISSLLWGFFSATEIIGLGSPTIGASCSIAFYFISTGVLCTILVAKYNSVWVSYSFRIGIISLTPLILPSLLVESDAFFGTKLTMYNAEGPGVSLLIGAIAFFIGISTSKNKSILTA